MTLAPLLTILALIAFGLACYVGFILLFNPSSRPKPWRCNSGGCPGDVLSDEEGVFWQCRECERKSR